MTYRTRDGWAVIGALGRPLLQTICHTREQCEAERAAFRDSDPDFEIAKVRVTVIDPANPP